MLNLAVVVLAITASCFWFGSSRALVRATKVKANRPMPPYKYQCRSCGKTFEMPRLS